jgi:hypothetical protein
MPGIVVDELALSERDGLQSQAIGERDDDPLLSPLVCFLLSPRHRIKFSASEFGKPHGSAILTRDRP